MNTQEITEALAHNTGKFPFDAMRAAIADPKAITPVLLDELNRLADDPQAVLAEPGSYVRHIFAMYLLAQFRETRAYAPLVKICHLPNDDLVFLLEDVITEGLPRILASVCDGNIAPIKEIIENENLDEFVRGAGLTALITLVAEGALSRDEVIDYLRDFSRALPSDSPMWNQFALAAETLYPEELLPQLRDAFAKNLIDKFLISMSDIQRSIAVGREHALKELRKRNRYVTDAIAELDRWACFREEEKPLDYPLAETELYPPAYWTPSTVFRDMPKIGRNDPCPCGSGKKYKKCCMPG